MEEVLKAFAPLAAYLTVLFAFVLPSVISITQRIKTDAVPGAKPWQIWLMSIALGVIGAQAEALVLSRTGLIMPEAQLVTPDVLSTTVFGVLVGLSASGLVDLRKMGVVHDRE